MNLYDLAENFRRLFEELAEKEEWTAEDMERIQSYDGGFEEKAINMAKYIQELKANLTKVECEIDRLDHRAHKLQKQIRHLSEFLLSSMTKVQKEKISSDLFDIKIRKNPVKVVITDESKIPRDYFTRKETYMPDKMLIRLDINKGIEVPGAVLTQDVSLQIK